MTALVYLAIIALWAVFLIPWLGRHRDEQNGRRSGERYNRAMNTLARNRRDRESTPDAAEEPTAGVGEFEEEWEPARAQPLHALGSFLSGLRPSHGRPHPSGSSRAARRRRIALMLIVGAFALALAGAAVGPLPWAAPAVLLTILVAYVAALFRQARSRRGASAAAEGETDRYREAARRASRDARVVMEGQASSETRGSVGWDARPTTLPTYVSKPKASKVPRIMDLTGPGQEWTGQAMVLKAQEQRRAREAQAQFEREMAVVEPDPVVEIERLANLSDRPAARQTYRRAANG